MAGTHLVLLASYGEHDIVGQAPQVAQPDEHARPCKVVLVGMNAKLLHLRPQKTPLHVQVGCEHGHVEDALVQLLRLNVAIDRQLLRQQIDIRNFVCHAGDEDDWPHDRLFAAPHATHLLLGIAGIVVAIADELQNHVLRDEHQQTHRHDDEDFQAQLGLSEFGTLLLLRCGTLGSVGGCRRTVCRIFF